MSLERSALPSSSPADVATMRDAVEAATSLVALRKALRMDRVGRRDPEAQAVRRRLFEQMPEDGVSYLARAAYRGSVERVRLLLEAGANPNQIQAGLSDHDPDMPVIDPRNPPLVIALRHAAHSEYSNTVARERAVKVEAMVALLLDAGADVHALSNLGKPLLHETVSLPGLWLDGVAVRLMTRFIGDGLDPAAVIPLFGETALHILVQQRTPPMELVEALVTLGVPLGVREKHGQTVLDRVRLWRDSDPVLLATLERLEIEVERAALREAFDDSTSAPLSARAPRSRL